MRLLSRALQKLVYLKVSGGVLQVFRNEAAFGFICYQFEVLLIKSLSIAKHSHNLCHKLAREELRQPGKTTAGEFARLSNLRSISVLIKVKFPRSKRKSNLALISSE